MPPKTIIHQDPWLGELVLALTRKLNLVTEPSAHSEAEICESIREYQSILLYSTRDMRVRIFLSMHDVRKCVENIIFHASHAEFHVIPTVSTQKFRLQYIHMWLCFCVQNFHQTIR